MMEAIVERFGENLRRYRRRSGLSQEALAVRASLHRTEVGLLERGERQPRISTLVKLAGSLGVAPENLLEGIAWNPGDLTVGGFKFSTPAERHAQAMERAAELRANQTETVDAAKLTREAREELERRGLFPADEEDE